MVMRLVRIAPFALILSLVMSPTPTVITAQEPCPLGDCTAGRDVGRDFFVEVLEQLADVPACTFAIDALSTWEPHENTAACWNPLATTWTVSGSCNFNCFDPPACTMGVQHYLSQAMGARATANTLALGYYDHIRSMLRQERFDREGLREDLSTWDTCNGQTCDPLLDEWERLWDALGDPIDVYMVVDLSGSFIDDLPNFQSQAPQMISDLTDSNPNTRFGLAMHVDYPIYPLGYGFFGDKAYERLADLTCDPNPVLNAISGLSARGGADTPESQLVALYQAATGAGQDLSGVDYPEASIPPGQQANFRDGSQKLLLLWTDALFHKAGDPGPGGTIPYPGPTFGETVSAIRALDPPKVLGVYGQLGEDTTQLHLRCPIAIGPLR